MELNNQYLAMLLDAPLQSWGYMSRFDRRTTLGYPTRSGIIGMLCAAMGIDRKENTLLQKFKNSTLSVFIIKQGGRLIDYHTVGGGWLKNKNPQNIVPRTNGTPADNAVITYREYLEDSKYLVVLKDEPDFLEEIGNALQHPKWGIWLGRKACIPAMPVYQGIFPNIEAAIHQLETLYKKPNKVIFEVTDYEDGSDTLMTEPLDFAKREFAPCRIKVSPY